MPFKKHEAIDAKEYIFEAFKKLLKDQHYDKITVLDITNQAQINRATFYLYFKDKQELYTIFYQRYMKQIEHILSALKSPTYINKKIELYTTTPLPPITAMLSYLRKEKNVTKTLFGDTGHIKVLRDLSDLFERYYLFLYNKDRPVRFIKKGKTIENDTRYILIALVGMVVRWIEDDMKRPVDEVAIDFVKFSLKL
ncbi:TetR family transcriptional regulator [Lysinibacillus alkalisoli]|uniref:TetR family transcriptional regulator n=1 Tax=Lysinibacillus alkalisoli TaxID=1911548 RepID=A0A917LD87_9BACI|nr:TetR/AcrR family transcriptional regulator [Lysinibacillus alkalisoli]GGG14509.1 TetR family transcriptional regulator [Lysinibacillus alkalisoli]